MEPVETAASQPWVVSISGYWPVLLLLSSLFWLIVYLMDGQNSRLFGATYTTLSGDQQLEWHSRIASTMHALFSTGVGLVCLCQPELWAAKQTGFRWEITIGLTLTAGYMLVDGLFMFRYMRVGTEMLQYEFHHFMGLVGACSFLAQPYVHFFLALRYLTEFSTPFVNQMWFLRTSGAAQTWPTLSLVNSMLLMVTFVGTRILPLPWYWYVVAQELNASGFHTLRDRPVSAFSWLCLAFLIDCLNVFWTKKLLAGAKKLVTKYFARGEKSS